MCAMHNRYYHSSLNYECSMCGNHFNSTYELAIHHATIDHLDIYGDTGSDSDNDPDQILEVEEEEGNSI
ncbi:hypothetical protein QYF36_020053 [Acer negundo]|nr:hypothetical protein QYF36_020053 [Acer negundo]